MGGDDGNNKDKYYYVNYKFWNSLREFENGVLEQSLQETYEDFIYLFLLSKEDKYHGMLYKMKEHIQNIMGRDTLKNDCVCKFTEPIFEKISSLMSEDEGDEDRYPFWKLLLYHIDGHIYTAENICYKYIHFLNLMDNLRCDIIHKKVMEQCKIMAKKGYTDIEIVLEKAINRQRHFFEDYISQ